MTAHEVDIWTICLDESRRNLLSPDEQERAARLRFERDRIHWTHARSALREILSDYVGVAPADLVFSLGENGKPFVRGIEFNLSHTRGWAMIAVAGKVPTGVDIERIREDIDMRRMLERIGETVLESGRAALFQQWARREARTKALGSQLMSMPPPEIRAVDLRAPEGFAAAVALAGHIPVARYR